MHEILQHKMYGVSNATNKKLGLTGTKEHHLPSETVQTASR